MLPSTRNIETTSETEEKSDEPGASETEKVQNLKRRHSLEPDQTKPNQRPL